MAFEMRETSSLLTLANRWNHFLASLGINRMGHRLELDLYKLGNPNPDSIVFITAKYTLS